MFPRRTSCTPSDVYAFVGDPPLWRPEADEVHISVVFTWDVDEGRRLAEAWGQYYRRVILGGPAIDGEGEDFTGGMYVKRGITFTSRGCIRRCPWCLVGGPLRLLDPFEPGWIVQDNNLLATGKKHMEKVFEMLTKQAKAAKFAGGLDPRLLDDWVAEQLSRLRVSEIFLAADTKETLGSLSTAVERLHFFPRHKLRCYVLCGYGGETPEQAEERLTEVWARGCLPFAQLYQPPGHYIEYSGDWKRLARRWSRPAATHTWMRGLCGTHRALSMEWF